MEQSRRILLTILVFLTITTVLAVYSTATSINKHKSSADFLLAGKTVPSIGVIKIYGAIAITGETTIFGEQGGSDAIVAQLDRFLNNNLIKAVVIRIDSPGGTVAATQEIYNKIMKLRARNIPVVASMGDIAASGGYYVASACNYIIANHGTLTGSIGVILASPDLTGLMEKTGIKMNVIKSGSYKDILSSTRTLSPDETALLQEIIDITYRQFLKDVSLGRNLPISDFEAYADGRIFTGDQAVKYRLVDEIGTFEDSIAKARKLADLPENAPIFEEEYSPFEKLLAGMGMSSKSLKKIENTIGSTLNPYIKIEYRFVQ
jgi:protease-4